MNTNLIAKRILCYGDSNTNGRIPGPESKRFPINIRWTGVLQKLLGEGYDVIEEGLNGRTTVFDDNERFGRNGLTYLLPCIETHIPINIFIVSLGTNDLKERYRLKAEQIGENFEKLLSEAINKLKEKQTNLPEIIVMAPPLVDESVPLTQENYKGAEAKSKQLCVLYSKIAEKYHTKFIDLAKLLSPSKVDGYHLDEASHKKIAEELANLIK